MARRFNASTGVPDSMSPNQERQDPQEPGREWRELVSVSSDAEARLIEGWLENEGIECQLESLVFTQEPVQFGLLGGVRVHVPAAEHARAERLLEQIRDPTAGEGEGEP